MPNEVLVKTGAQFLFADHAIDFGVAPTTAANSLIIGTPQNKQLDLTGLAAVGGAREANKADLTSRWASLWATYACLEFETAPADGGAVYFYWGASPSSTDGTGNPGGLTGLDAAFTDTSGNLAQMQRIGSLIVKNTVINIGKVGLFTPHFQYGTLLVVNQASTALRSTATAMDETHITMTELISEIQ